MPLKTAGQARPTQLDFGLQIADCDRLVIRNPQSSHPVRCEWTVGNRLQRRYHPPVRNSGTGKESLGPGAPGSARFAVRMDSGIAVAILGVTKHVLRRLSPSSGGGADSSVLLSVGRQVSAVLLTLAVVGASGCVVGQAPGRGQCIHLREATTGASYWLYLPQGYDEPPPPGQARPMRPLVMTFHGMKPFDDAHRQIREWQQEADRYGFVVCAPRLTVAAVSGPLPLRDRNHPSLKRDEKAIIAVMDELYRTVDVDPNHVLATSWSYGGYIAHYMANRYPERFSCIAVRQSNFNADILDSAQVPRYRDRKVAIYFTENDFAICRRESRRAAEWYARHGFDLTYAVFEKKGHERTPGVAAEFFARTCGAEAKTPPVELALMQVTEIPVPTYEHSVVGSFASIPPLVKSDGRASTAQPRRMGSSQRAPAKGASVFSHRTQEPPPNSRTDGRPAPINGRARSIFPPTNAASGTARNVTLKTRPVAPNHRVPAARRAATPIKKPGPGPVKIRVSSTIGVAPLLVSYSAAMPKAIQEQASFLWAVNGEPISNDLNGQKFFSVPGKYELAVLVAAKDGVEYYASRTITVIGRVSKPGRK